MIRMVKNKKKLMSLNMKEIPATITSNPKKDTMSKANPTNANPIFKNSGIISKKSVHIMM